MEEGDCFEANSNFVIEHFLDKKRNTPNVFICHGMVVGAEDSPVAGMEFEHCWIEVEDEIWDFSNGRKICVKKDSLYSKGRIVAGTVKRYTPMQMAQNLLKYGHYGSWS